MARGAWRAAGVVATCECEGERERGAESATGFMGVLARAGGTFVCCCASVERERRSREEGEERRGKRVEEERRGTRGGGRGEGGRGEGDMGRGTRGGIKGSGRTSIISRYMYIYTRHDMDPRECEGDTARDRGR